MCWLTATHLQLTRRKQNGLHLAAERGHSHVVKFLLEKGIPVDAVDADGRSAYAQSPIDIKPVSIRLLISRVRVGCALQAVPGCGPGCDRGVRAARRIQGRPQHALHPGGARHLFLAIAAIG